MPALSLIMLLSASIPDPRFFPSPETAVVATAPAAAPPPAAPSPGPAGGSRATGTPPADGPPSARSTARAAAAASDLAENLVGGVWQCETIAGDTGTLTYTAGDEDGTIELQTVLHAGFRTFDISEVYRFDGARNTWTASTAGGAFTGTAQPWTHDKWIFEGTADASGQRRPLRMVYFDLGKDAFRRDFQARQGNVWRTYSAETCKRPSD